MSAPADIETRLFINGEFAPSSDKKTFQLVSPGNREVVAEVSEASEDDTDRAVASAHAAFPAWSALSPPQRGSYFKKLATLLRRPETVSELAWLEASSMGRPVSTYFDAYAAAETFDHYAEAGYEALGTSSLNTPGHVTMTLRQPYGVVAAIIPWNVPLLFFANKAAPALAAGNCVVVKSSEKAPLTSARMAALILEAGFPPGVINVLSGHGHRSGAILSSHMDVRALTFTGSGRTGRIITKAAADSNLKNVILELGGKSPAVIFEDADLEDAAQGTQYSIQWNSGQVCMANSRIYVQESVADKFVELFKSKFGAVKIGDPTDPDTKHGPLADEAQFKTVSRYLELGQQVGKLVLGGQTSSTSYVVNPTVFTDAAEDTQIMKEEVFGPVVCINTFNSEADALARANNTEYGLYASVYTKDLDRALRFAKGLESGYVGVNCTSPSLAKDMPFGGYKSSGVGREGYGLLGSIGNFLETKTVIIKVNGM